MAGSWDWAVAAEGYDAVPPPALGIAIGGSGPWASRPEELIYKELYRRMGPPGRDWVYQFAPRDIAYTPELEDRSLDFYLPPMDLGINPISAFTHPDRGADAYNRFLFSLLGIRVFELWDYEILPEMGGSPVQAIDSVPGMTFFGEAVSKLDSAQGRRRRYGQPPRITPYGQYGFSDL